MADLYGYVAWSFLCWAALNPNKTYIQVVQIAFLNFSKPEQEFDLLSPVAPCQSSPFSFSPLQRSSCMTYFRWVLTLAWHCKQTSPVLSYLTPHWAPPHTASVFRTQKCSGWMGLWAIWSGGRCPCIQQGVGTRQSLKSLPTQTFPWFSAPPLKIGVK